MTKELDVEKIIKRVQTEADKKNQKRFDGMMEILNDKFRIVTEQFKNIYENFDKINHTLDSHGEQIANLLMDTTEIKSDLRQVKLVVDNLIEDKVDKKHFIDLDQRVRRLEKK